MGEQEEWVGKRAVTKRDGHFRPRAISCCGLSHLKKLQPLPGDKTRDGTGHTGRPTMCPSWAQMVAPSSGHPPPPGARLPPLLNPSGDETEAPRRDWPCQVWTVTCVPHPV